MTRLVESKAKLTPVDHHGNPVKSEMCGAVFASRQKKYFEDHCQIKVKRWHHFLDSQTVLGAIQRDSYGFQTFFANRVGEIQSSTGTEDWSWIPGSLNIADIITRGTDAENLNESSEWQIGPTFLSLPEEEWPLKSAKELATTAKENDDKLQKKTFSAVTTRAKAKTLEIEKASCQISCPKHHKC